MSDEDVIRRRLLIDGDGTGDDRRLNALLKSFVKWCNAVDEPESESSQTHDRMLAQLAQCEFAVAKSCLTSQMSAAEMQNYENLSKQIEADIAQAKDDIEKTKHEFRNARVIRSNRIEYDLLAKVINEQPDRKKTTEELKQLQSDLQSLQEKKEMLENKLEMRRKQFRVMLTSIHHLTALLDESDADEMMDVSLDDVDGEESDSAVPG